MTKKLVRCPKCGESSFIELGKEKRSIKKKDADKTEKILKAMLKVPAPKS